MVTLFSRVRLLTCVFLLGTFAAHRASADHVQWNSNVETSLRTANDSGKLVLMKFTADWCGYCKKMERETFARPQVAALVNSQFVPVLVDADQHKALVEHLKIQGLPAILVVSPEMVILERISGFQTEDKLLPKLTHIVARHQQTHPSQMTVAASSGFAPAATRPVSQQTMAPKPPVETTQQAPFQPTAPTGPPAVFDEPSFAGLCLPAVQETRSLVRGIPQFAARYRGKTLYFSTEEHLQKFQKDPTRYWPMRDGVCPVQLLETGQSVEGRLEYAAMFRDRLWVMSSPENMQTFVAHPAHFVDALEAR
ncbi:MAG: thioredoxin family protein [Planctomycetaceae bacterium]